MEKVKWTMDQLEKEGCSFDVRLDDISKDLEKTTWWLAWVGEKESQSFAKLKSFAFEVEKKESELKNIMLLTDSKIAEWKMNALSLEDKDLVNLKERHIFIIEENDFWKRICDALYAKVEILKTVASLQRIIFKSTEENKEIKEMNLKLGKRGQK
jgi:hypothetical protein